MTDFADQVDGARCSVYIGQPASKRAAAQSPHLLLKVPMNNVRFTTFHPYPYPVLPSSPFRDLVLLYMEKGAESLMPESACSIRTPAKRHAFHVSALSGVAQATAIQRTLTVPFHLLKVPLDAMIANGRHGVWAGHQAGLSFQKSSPTPSAVFCSALFHSKL